MMESGQIVERGAYESLCAGSDRFKDLMSRFGRDSVEEKAGKEEQIASGSKVNAQQAIRPEGRGTLEVSETCRYH